jgi:hypothetical protein
LLGIVPDKFALPLAEELRLSISMLPFKMELIPLHLYWHKRHANDTEHRWIRERILELLEPWDALSHPVSFAPGKGARARRSPSRQKGANRDGQTR